MNSKLVIIFSLSILGYVSASPIEEVGKTDNQDDNSTELMGPDKVVSSEEDDGTGPRLNSMGHHHVIVLPDYSNDELSEEDDTAYNLGFLSKLHMVLSALQQKVEDMRTQLLTTMDVDKLPNDYSNNTFREEVINGTKIRVNETIHRRNDNNTDVFFFHKVLSIVPEEPEVEEFASTTMTPNDAETTISNEIEKSEILRARRSMDDDFDSEFDATSEELDW